MKTVSFRRYLELAETMSQEELHNLLVTEQHDNEKLRKYPKSKVGKYKDNELDWEYNREYFEI